MKVIIVPDVHGRNFWKKAIENVNNVDQIVFLGDYFDPYAYEFKDQKNLFSQTYNNALDILEFKKQYPEKVTLLLGNHCWSYIDDNYACSRHDYYNEGEIHDFFTDNRSMFQNCKVIGNILFTHAGVSIDWLDFCNFNYTNIEKFLNEDIEISKLMMCSGYRGGPDKYSGPMWNDYHEFSYLEPYADYIQIFGHTQLLEIGDYKYGNNWYCIDSKRCFLLNDITGELISL